MVTDPGYATYHGGPQNVTAAKVTLMNRVNQIYEDETAIRLVLIADNDKLNLDTQALLMGPNGPCGAAPCYVTPPTCNGANLQRTRTVIGQLIGASNYDIGHLALGTPGGGVASLGVVGGNGKAQGCTGLATPIGDFFAVDYVAHEMGHQFAGNHTFNGTLVNCSGGNRSAANSVEPGSGTSIMAYAGICGQDNLQPHSDPYWSQRSFDEITAYVTSTRPPISEVQTVSLRDFDADGESLRLRLDGPTRGRSCAARATRCRASPTPSTATRCRPSRRAPVRSRSATSAPRRRRSCRARTTRSSGSRTRSWAATSSRW